MVEEVGKDLAPDDDWEPIAFLLHDDESRSLLPLVYENDEQKDLWANALLPALVVGTRPKIVSMVQTAWFVEAPPDAILEGTVRPRDDPNRKEGVVVTCVASNDEQVWQAMIERREGKPPKLGEWMLIGGPNAETMGRFIDPLRRALRVANTGEAETDETEN